MEETETDSDMEMDTLSTTSCDSEKRTTSKPKAHAKKTKFETEKLNRLYAKILTEKTKTKQLLEASQNIAPTTDPQRAKKNNRYTRYTFVYKNVPCRVDNICGLGTTWRGFVEILKEHLAVVHLPEFDFALDFCEQSLENKLKFYVGFHCNHLKDDPTFPGGKQKGVDYVVTQLHVLVDKFNFFLSSDGNTHSNTNRRITCIDKFKQC